MVAAGSEDVAHVRWHRGGEADLLELLGDRTRMRSTVSSAPGSRLEGALADGRTFRLKVHRCRRISDDKAEFELDGRLLDATREVRAALLVLLCGSRA